MEKEGEQVWKEGVGGNDKRKVGVTAHIICNAKHLLLMFECFDACFNSHQWSQTPAA